VSFDLRQVSHRYDGEVVLDLPSFAGEQGEHWLVLGPSGCGKTTLLHVMAGLLRPTSGTVRVAGKDLAQLGGAALDRFRGASIGIVFQQLHLLPTLNVAENLLVAPYMAGLDQDAARVREVLDGLGMASKQRAYPSELSYGQQQRVAIARAVINRPALILADEPTSGLDDVHCERVLELLIGQAQAHEATLIVATHDRRIGERFERRLSLETPGATAEPHEARS
jgi:putative ABC transport system ATP-binding protein